MMSTRNANVYLFTVLISPVPPAKNDASKCNSGVAYQISSISDIYIILITIENYSYEVTMKQFYGWESQHEELY